MTQLLKRIKYGNRVSRLVQPDLSQATWLFEVVFDYDEGHYETVDPDPSLPSAEQHRFARASVTPAHPWAARPDPFSSHRAGFEVRTYRRCRRVLMFHHIPDLPTGEDGYEGLARPADRGGRLRRTRPVHRVRLCRPRLQSTGLRGRRTGPSGQYPHRIPRPSCRRARVAVRNRSDPCWWRWVPSSLRCR
ncbi:SpvB/TcaC N-terminal domain-containing protein [Streptomyces sp. 1222.2]|uniref:SpvB/TcaC N-terminal domain-containing protein n=1 Tax=Streptomyces sp. 1222.2 TaxID=1938833 RepID=UPI0015CEF6CB